MTRGVISVIPDGIIIPLTNTLKQINTETERIYVTHEYLPNNFLCVSALRFLIGLDDILFPAGNAGVILRNFKVP